MKCDFDHACPISFQPERTFFAVPTILSKDRVYKNILSPDIFSHKLKNVHDTAAK